MSLNAHSIDNLLPVNSVGKGSTYVESKVELSPEFAEDFLQHDEFIAERKSDEGWSSHLADEMVRKTFRFEQVKLARAHFRGKIFRVNGQHTCHARLELQDEDIYSVEVTLLEYTVKTYEDLRLLYMSFDNHKTRTRAQRLAAALKGFENWEGVTDKMIRHVCAGFSIWQKDKRREELKDASNVGFLLQKEFQGLGVAVGEFLGLNAASRGTKHLCRAGVVGSMLATFNQNKKEAGDFWKVIATGIGIEEGDDPRRLLRDGLMTSTKVPKRLEITIDEYLYRMAVLAWNAHRKHQKRKVLAVQGGARPTVQ